MSCTLPINGVYWGYNPLILTFDPNFLGHPSKIEATSSKIRKRKDRLPVPTIFFLFGRDVSFVFRGISPLIAFLLESQSCWVSPTPMVFSHEKITRCLVPPHLTTHIGVVKKIGHVKPEAPEKSWMVVLLKKTEEILGDSLDSNVWWCTMNIHDPWSK